MKPQAIMKNIFAEDDQVAVDVHKHISSWLKLEKYVRNFKMRQLNFPGKIELVLKLYEY